MKIDTHFSRTTTDYLKVVVSMSLFAVCFLYGRRLFELFRPVNPPSMKTKRPKIHFSSVN